MTMASGIHRWANWDGCPGTGKRPVTSKKGSETKSTHGKKTTMSHSQPHDSPSRSPQPQGARPSGSAPRNQSQPQNPSAAPQNPPGREHEPLRQKQPGQQQQYQARNTPPAQAGPGAQGTPNRVGQNQAGQAQSREDRDAADSRKVAARQENDRLQSANRREDGADRQGASFDNAEGGIADAARRQSVEPNRPSPGTPQGEEGGEVGQDASRGSQRTAGTAREPGSTNRNQTDKDRQAMKNR